MRTVVFGGTFNPIHNGHLYISEELRIQMGYERVIFVPSNIPAHKPSTELVSPDHRVEMLNLALLNSSAIVDRCEIDRGGVSYSIDTVRYLKTRYNITGKLGLFIGDDLIDGIRTWHRIDQLLEEVELVVARRLSRSVLSDAPVFSIMDNIKLEISSSDIRKRVFQEEAFRYLVPENVFTYIKDKGLYKADV